MAKYYVQSGERKMVLTAADPRAAALWLVHGSLGKAIPAYEDPRLTEDDRCEIALMKGLMELGDCATISERGFDRMDAQKIDIFELIYEWHQLMSALLKFEAQQRDQF